jgi:predicted nucleic acid-binding protein
VRFSVAEWVVNEVLFKIDDTIDKERRDMEPAVRRALRDTILGRAYNLFEAMCPLSPRHSDAILDMRREARRIHGRYGIGLTDAYIIATAVSCKRSHVISCDRKRTSVPNIILWCGPSARFMGSCAQ